MQNRIGKGDSISTGPREVMAPSNLRKGQERRTVETNLEVIHTRSVGTENRHNDAFGKGAFIKSPKGCSGRWLTSTFRPQMNRYWERRPRGQKKRISIGRGKARVGLHEAPAAHQAVSCKLTSGKRQPLRNGTNRFGFDRYGKPDQRKGDQRKGESTMLFHRRSFNHCGGSQVRNS